MKGKENKEKNGDKNFRKKVCVFLNVMRRNVCGSALLRGRQKYLALRSALLRGRQKYLALRSALLRGRQKYLALRPEGASKQGKCFPHSEL
jgi:hypothetical protein